MNALNRVLTSFFDVVLAPLEAVGDEFALLVVAGVFSVLALWVFKHISWQKGIAATKNKIKGHLIEIRLYQDDLGIVSKAIGKVLLANLKYLALNFGPFIPLSIPFALVAAQMVVRYGFEPIPVQHPEARLVAGDGQTLVVEGDRASIEGLEVQWPEGLTRVSPVARVPSQGASAVEFVAERPGTYEVVVRPGAGGKAVKKTIVVGDGTPARAMQDQRVTGLLGSILWPAEDTLEGTGLDLVAFRYPESDLGWLPFSGPFGVLIVFIVASMAVGFLFLKPLGVQI